MTIRTTSLQSTMTSGADYFEYEPSSCDVSPVKAAKKANVHCLDAFHDRTEAAFDYPMNANLYTKRALPPLPPPLSAVPALQKCSSSDSMCSRPASRPNTAMANRQSCEKALPPLPALHACPSLETIASESCDQDNTRVSRPRSGRSISFRGFLNRNSAASSSADDVPSLTSSMISVSTRDSRTESVVGEFNLARIGTDGSMISSAPISRRPSTLSLTQLRAASKKVNSAPPPLPVRPTTGRKHSIGAGSGHRWNPFGRNSEEDKEDIPPMPVTPPIVQELSFTQCYYFFARNCHGYILSNGTNGDACENCAGAGYLGSP